MLIRHKLVDDEWERELCRGRNAVDCGTGNKHVDRRRLGTNGRADHAKHLATDQKVAAAQNVAEAADDEHADAADDNTGITDPNVGGRVTEVGIDHSKGAGLGRSGKLDSVQNKGKSLGIVPVS